MTTGKRATEIANVLGQLVELLADQPRAEVPAPRPLPPRQLLTVEEAAELLNIGKTKTYSLVKSGELKSVLIGRLRRIHIDAINEYAAKLVATSSASQEQ